jgi:hypothetical protein
MLFIFLILAAIVLAQPSSPAQGIQIGDDYDIRFPLTVTQCEPVFIFYNVPSSSTAFVTLSTGSDNTFLFSIGPSVGDTGYFEWICNIPAGYGFWATSRPYIFHYTVVQPGPLSSCLHNLNRTYQYASYNTIAFASYTEHPAITTTVSLPVGFLAT